MLGLCALALDKTDSIKTAIRHLGFCLEVYNDLERSDLSSTALFRYHEVLENTLGETPLFLALVRAAVSHKVCP